MEMVKGKLAEMGEIPVQEIGSAEVHTYPMALVITFDKVEDIRKAIADGACRFAYGNDGDSRSEG
jgi:anti-sigma28 factor (negative regulator of flagellin synthesis)